MTWDATGQHNVLDMPTQLQTLSLHGYIPSWIPMDGTEEGGDRNAFWQQQEWPGQPQHDFALMPMEFVYLMPEMT